MYTRESRLSKAGRPRLLEHFALGTTARAAAEPVGASRNTVNRFYFALRTIVAEEMEKAAPLHREWKWTRAIPAAGARVNEVEELLVRCRCSAC